LVAEARASECLGRYEGFLRRQGLLDDTLEQEIKGSAADLMRAGIAAAEAQPAPDPGLLFEHALVDPPASFQTDLSELRRIIGG